MGVSGAQTQEEREAEQKVVQAAADAAAKQKLEAENREKAKQELAELMTAAKEAADKELAQEEAAAKLAASPEDAEAPAAAPGALQSVKIVILAVTPLSCNVKGHT